MADTVSLGKITDEKFNKIVEEYEIDVGSDNDVKLSFVKTTSDPKNLTANTSNNSKHVIWRDLYFFVGDLLSGIDNKSKL